MNETPNLRALKTKPESEREELLGEIEEYLRDVGELMRVIAAEHKALVDSGMGAMAAAVLLGTRYRRAD